MNTKEKDVGEFFRDSLQGWETHAPDTAWKQIQRNAELKKYNRHRLLQRGGRYAIISIMAGVVVLGVVYFLVSPKDSEDPLIFSQVQDTLYNIPMHSENPSIAIAEVGGVDTKRGEPDLFSTSLPAEEPQLVNVNTETFFPNNTEQEIYPVGIPEPEVEDKISSLQVMPIQDSGLEKLDSKMITLEESVEIRENEHPVSSPVEAGESSLQPGYVEHKEVNQQEERDILLIPNSFTPDGDGINDYFHIYAREEVTDFEIAVYDRQSRPVFISRDILQGWNGESGGKMQPSGIYLYVITFKDVEGKRHTKRGSLYLSR